MRSNRPSRKPAHQPELPLAGGNTAEPAPSASEPRPPEWRLDERTRLIGRQGIAAARALLAAHDPADHRSDGPGRGRHSGRAA
ncbi:MAG TPA: hypothetical protein VG014_09320 [Acidimicrobiales bacterium]|nr:hypothetical protein [Acidimicrobiales bacterium]